MSDIKWIKVAADMFEDSKIEFIRSLPEGDAIIVTWIQMLSIAGQSNAGGYLMVTDGIPYSEQLLSNKLRRQPVFLQFALDTLIKLRMINIEDGPYHITKWEKHQNITGMEKVRLDTAKRVAKHRLKQKETMKLLQSNEDVTLHVTHEVTHEVTRGNEIEVEVDKEKDTTLLNMNFEKVIDAYQQIHGKLMPYQDSPILERILKDSFEPELIIGIMRDRYKASVKTFRYYEGAIRDSAERSPASGPSRIGREGKAARQNSYRDSFLGSDPDEEI